MSTLQTLSTTSTPITSHQLPSSSSQTTQDFNVGTRKSKLALKQTELVLAEATKTCQEFTFTVKARDTAAGDIDKVTPFKDMAVKNLWTHELETLMGEGSLDFLVHSLKDVPTQLPPNCEIGATIQRSDSRDAFVIKPNHSSGAQRIQDLPVGSVIGTSSIRRTAQIALKYPHLRVLDLRGNIDTRLRKLDDPNGPYDAIIIASAGLLRIDLGHRITQYLSSRDGGMLYAVGQGAIGVENRSDDSTVKEIMRRINHLPTFYATTAERSLLRTIEGGCSAPLGVEAQWTRGGGGAQTGNENGDGKWEGGDVLTLSAIVVSVDGKEFAEASASGKVASVVEAEQLGQTVAAEILRRGADKILAEIKAKKPTTAADLEEK